MPQKELQGPDSPDSRILATIQVSNFVICPVGFEAICPEEADFETKVTSEDPFATFDPATFPGGNRFTPEGSTLVRTSRHVYYILGISNTSTYS